MRIACDDKVRPNNPNLGLPISSIWRVLSTIGGLKLYPHSDDAAAVQHLVVGLRFKSEDFTRQTRNAVGDWVDDEPCRESKAGAKAREAVKQAADFAARLGDALAKARATEHLRKAALRAAQLEAQRKEELRKAEAEARAYEKSHALRARLHADRCLGEATLELIAEVSRLHNGGPEAAAHASIANHADQLQPLARSYGYRIVKPSMVALVVKL